MGLPSRDTLEAVDVLACRRTPKSVPGYRTWRSGADSWDRRLVMVEQTRWTFGLRSCRTRGVCELCRYDKYVCAGTIGRRKGVRGTSGHGLLGFEHRGEEGVHCRHTGQKDEQGSEILRTSEAGRRRKRRMHTS
eukprot:3850590-Rhodomonas_salina.1